jgi:carbon storage regulator
MLVIRRKAGESIVVDGEIEIVVLTVSPTRVKLGIHAPEGVPVCRKELAEAAEENRRAMQSRWPSALSELARSLHLP